MQLRVKKAVDNQILNVIHAQLCYTLGPELMQRLKNNKKKVGNTHRPFLQQKYKITLSFGEDRGV
jgi:hypothetical protein